MPLKKGKKNIGKNYKEMRRTGASKKQAIAAALKAAGIPKAKKPRKSK